MKDFVVVDKEFMERATNAILEVETLMTAHDNLQRELSDIKRLMGKDKHALIKSNIALNKKVQELEEDYEYLSHHYGIETEQNKRYREGIERLIRNLEGRVDYILFDEIKDFVEALEGEE